MPDLSNYRPCVGIVLFNKNGKVWVGKRFGQKGPHSWQFPQGGIDEGEAPKLAAIRELWEETGVTQDHLKYLGKTKKWLAYDYPKNYTGRKVSKGWLGQKQKWYAFEYLGKKKHFDLMAHPPQEFSEWRWEDLEKTPDLIVPFKRKVYEQLVIAFKDYTRPRKDSTAEHE